MPPELRAAVRDRYSNVARDPRQEQAFPVGRAFAENVGYPSDVLAQLPPSVPEAFTGVSNVAVFAEIGPADTVLDLACGAGLDTLITGRRIGSQGRVVGIDFSPAMIRRAHAAAPEMMFVIGDAERLPLADASIDVGLANGVFNLNPARDAIASELARVVRPGGLVFGAELVLREPPQARGQGDAGDWFA